MNVPFDQLWTRKAAIHGPTPGRHVAAAWISSTEAENMRTVRVDAKLRKRPAGQWVSCLYGGSSRGGGSRLTDGDFADRKRIA